MRLGHLVLATAVSCSSPNPALTPRPAPGAGTCPPDFVMTCAPVGVRAGAPCFDPRDCGPGLLCEVVEVAGQVGLCLPSADAGVPDAGPDAWAPSGEPPGF